MSRLIVMWHMLDNRRGAMMGIFAPPFFLVGVVAISWIERDFMDGLGWDVWPSGTALGPYGWATVLIFSITGLGQMAFASTLLAQAGDVFVRKVGAGLLLVSGFGMAMLAFKTDPPDADATWHGILHFAAYLTFLLGLLLAYVVLAWGSWNRLDRSSWRYVPLASLPWLGTFVLPDGLGATSYLFFAILLTPLLILAMRVLATDGWPTSRRAIRHDGPDAAPRRAPDEAEDHGAQLDTYGRSLRPSGTAVSPTTPPRSTKRMRSTGSTSLGSSL